MLRRTGISRSRTSQRLTDALSERRGLVGVVLLAVHLHQSLGHRQEERISLDSSFKMIDSFIHLPSLHPGCSRVLLIYGRIWIQLQNALKTLGGLGWLIDSEKSLA